ncbi:alkaline phosphatase [Nocardia sp. NPDC059246]
MAEMTTKAIDLLSKRKDGKGFLLQVEGALIDKGFRYWSTNSPFPQRFS